MSKTKYGHLGSITFDFSSFDASQASVLMYLVLFMYSRLRELFCFDLQGVVKFIWFTEIFRRRFPTAEIKPNNHNVHPLLGPEYIKRIIWSRSDGNDSQVSQKCK